MSAPTARMLWVIPNKGPIRLYLHNVLAKRELLEALDASLNVLTPAVRRFRNLLHANIAVETTVIQKAKERKAGEAEEDGEG